MSDLLKNFETILNIFREAGYEPKITQSNDVLFFDIDGDSLTPEIRERLWELGVTFNKETEQFYFS